ncbi:MULTISPECIES: alpha/beta hydrolase [unclassified Pseudofrankia]|uniref:alpha/beta hydrolase n=1 Tax=unclassified Pseudofrankia TaxID=2994372 RepID=UPI001F51D4A3|nr:MULTISPECIES: alpha/beta hydrolase [unclassified Pseudofrankia]MDT3439576.1 alpha/beta hydrolase [Pseudofrankia sp. BMG5.37]
MFVHGLWLTSESWQGWRARYEAAGHRTLAPEWPGMGLPLDELRLAPRASRVGLIEIVDAYAAVINQLDERPVIMGHSIGGLLVQLLLDRGLGSAGVAISPGGVKGVARIPLSTARSGLAVLGNPANTRRTVALTRRQWHYAFANTLSRAKSDELWERYSAPTPGRPLWQAATATLNPRAANKVDLHNADRPPLLIHANTADHTVPASLARAAYKVQRKTGAVTEIHEFPGRPHLTGLVEGWEQVADDALDWALGFPTGPIAAPATTATAHPIGKHR